jgi:hypothetical protein
MGGPDEEGVEEKRSEIQVQAEAGPTVHAVMTTSCIIWVLRVFIFLYNLESSTQTGGVFCTIWKAQHKPVGATLFSKCKTSRREANMRLRASGHESDHVQD